MKFSVVLAITIACFSIYFGTPSAFSRGRQAERQFAEWEVPLVGKRLEAEYYLGIGDTLEVFVWKNPDLSRSVMVNPDGMIHYPLIGKVKAATLTVEELRVDMEEKFSKYIRYPDVTITISAMAGRKVIILGEVSAPGIYTYKGQIDAVEALALAGDFTEDAKRESVIIVSNNLTENPEARRVNLFRTIRRGSSNPGLLLEHNDIVYVPRNFVSDFTETLDTLADWMSSVDKLSANIWDWKKEVKWLYQRNIKSLTTEHEAPLPVQ